MGSDHHSRGKGHIAENNKLIAAPLEDDGKDLYCVLLTARGGHVVKTKVNLCLLAIGKLRDHLQIAAAHFFGDVELRPDTLNKVEYGLGADLRKVRVMLPEPVEHLRCRSIIMEIKLFPHKITVGIK